MTNDQPVAVVTGGGSGIGLATSQRLDADGYRVAVIDLAADSAARAAGANGIGVAADITDPNQVDAAFSEIVERLGRVDLLVNNAGITGSQRATRCHETPIEDWDQVFAVNVRGIYLCARAALGPMLSQGSGHVVTVASVAGQVAFPARCAYTTSKGAALMFAKSLAVDYAGSGIRSNAVCPGFVETPMTKWRLDQPDLRAKQEAVIPMGRVAQPDEIAGVIAAVASDRFSYMTGAAVTVDGGWTSL